MEKLHCSQENLPKIAEKVLNKAIKLKNADQAVIIALYGDLGSGKTTFTKALGGLLGVIDPITSPTFIIERSYRTKHNDFSRLIHIDAYRLESGEELANLDFEKKVNNPENLIIIEWPEKVKDILPEEVLLCSFAIIDEKTREIKIND